ncbi:MAG: 30S ribosomal protein S17 [Candidatus Thermoplasmatota archaeon]|jgi:small subunit ribosomal protein S17|nr:30S ribosomal protein S17 [Candidatus Sysuiplasma jiujiangense]MBX8640005.1 30S ribosomal protein S17 [Candidatus Sysuiplasma jiujiangense]MCL4317283.1 30S ribosomal protein S17 [Candidatus Thermoplasmatota archaeon]MCL5253810.1 30S ribosomal protein S17 [Candidatus Thermoplasmatota archaeon]
MVTRDIGVTKWKPAAECSDSKCPYHGRLSVRGQSIIGRVVSAKMKGTVIVENEHRKFSHKYERYERRRRRYPAHLPGCIQIREGDEVRIMECRPLSKTVSFVVIERSGSA